MGADNSTQELSFPPDLSSDDTLHLAGLSIPGVFDDGSYILRLSIESGNDLITRSWLVENSNFTEVNSPNTGTFAGISTAASPSLLYGSVYGAGAATGPAVWADAMGYLLDDNVVIPNGGNLNSLLGVLEDWTVVGMTMPAVGPAPTPVSIVLLHPA